MNAQVGLELLILTSIIMLLSLLVLGAFIYIKSDIDPIVQSASVYEFYNRIIEYKKMAMVSCNNFNVTFEHNFGTDVIIDGNRIEGKFGVVYIKDVHFQGYRMNGSLFKFNLACNSGNFTIGVSR